MTEIRLPQLGDDVHYVAHGTPPGPDGKQAFQSRCRTAKVTEVGAWMRVSAGDHEVEYDDGHKVRQVQEVWRPTNVALWVFNPTGMFLHEACRYNDGMTMAGVDEVNPDEPVFVGGTWHWPTAWCPGPYPARGPFPGQPA